MFGGGSVSKQLLPCLDIQTLKRHKFTPREIWESLARSLERLVEPPRDSPPLVPISVRSVPSEWGGQHRGGRYVHPAEAVARTIRHPKRRNRRWEPPERDRYAYNLRRDDMKGPAIIEQTNLKARLEGWYPIRDEAHLFLAIRRYRRNCERYGFDPGTGKLITSEIV
jgi:hypothetical protein